jgi:hypothetical protein
MAEQTELQQPTPNTLTAELGGRTTQIPVITVSYYDIPTA